tara:strand:- start:57 stop:605 length:549 start_codon:yes stop_codon:yes gene_type:complete
MQKLFENWREFRKEILTEGLPLFALAPKAAAALKVALSAVKGNIIISAILRVLNYQVKGRPLYFWILDADVWASATGTLLYKIEMAKEGDKQKAFENWLIDVGVPLILIRPVMGHIVKIMGSAGGPAHWMRPDVIGIGVLLFMLYRSVIKYPKELAELGSSEEDQKRALELAKQFSKKGSDN